jgi:hypothetical protein
MKLAKWGTERERAAWLACAAMAACRDAPALDTMVSGRVMFGSVMRLEAADRNLLTALNAPLVGLAGYASGSNADDANLNWRRHDLVSTALKGTIDVSAKAADFSALVRIKAWRDFTLARRNRPWGNTPNSLTANAPLEDRGGASLSQFSGVALMDAWVQNSVDLGSVRLTGRLGRQTLAWGERGTVPGGLESLNARDGPALRRAGATAQETRVPAPMLFARLALAPALAFEGFVGGRFRPAALDMCGTFWALSDYLAQGCDVVMAGLPVLNDRARVRTGALMKRLPTPDVSDHDAGVAVLWKAWDADFGLHHARYTWRTPMPSLRRASRAGPAILPGDPDGRNMAYFTEYPENIAITALTFSRKTGATTTFGELSYRPRAPFMLSPGDVLPPFLSATTPALLRQAADQVAPGGLFHGYDLRPVAQLQFGVAHEAKLGVTPVSGALEVVAKHAMGLPDQALRRYGRADLFGVGPVFGTCAVTTAHPALQCSQSGYSTRDAWGYRLRIEARWPDVAPALASGLAATASAAFVHDVKGWSGDFLLNEGRKSLNLGVRLEYRQRYLLDVSWLPLWGGDYNAFSDRDTLALAAGVKF